MTFWLIVKQSVRDFKNKLELYLSFSIFLLVCLSIIVGLLGFCHVYTSTYDNVFNKSGYTQDTHLPSFYFLDKNVNADKNEFSHWQNKNPKRHYLVDNGSFEKYVEDILTQDEAHDKDSEYKGYEWGPAISKDLISEQMKLDWGSNHDYDNIINDIGNNRGYADWNLVNSIFHTIKTPDKGENGDASNGLWNTQQVMDKLIGKNSKDDDEKSISKSIFDHTIGQRPHKGELVGDDYKYVNYYAAIKLFRITMPTLDEMERNPEAKYYNAALTDKYIVDTKLTGNNSYKYGYDVQRNWPAAPYGDTSASLNISFMPQEQWMDDAFKSNTPEQFKQNDISNIWVKDRLSASEIPSDVLKDPKRPIAYVTPSFIHAHNLKLGDKIKNTWLTNDTGYVKDAGDVTIVGEAISRQGYYSNRNLGNIYLPIQYLNCMSPIGGLQHDSSASVSRYYWPGNSFGTISLYDAKAKGDMDEVSSDVISGLFGDFKVGDGHKDLFGAAYNLINPTEDFQVKVTKANILLFKILCYVISAGVAVLGIVVFWFISGESIKLQKKTLWFLKALGESKFKITLLPTIGVMVPFLIGAVLSIFGSLFINNIMSSAIGNSYAFYLPVWSFDVYSFIVLLIITAISVLIFAVMGYIQLSGKALSIHADAKIGWITKLYMKTKPMYRKLPTGTRIGISFMVQNVMKNILTLILLLISFAVVLFSMQFSSSARASAHSYERRNAPYKSLMLNKQNNVDAIELNTQYINKEFGKADEDGQQALAILSAEIAPLFGQGYTTANVNNSNDGEDQIAGEIYNDPINTAVAATAKIDNNEQLRTAMAAGINDVYNMLVNTDKNGKYEPLKYLKAQDAFSNKFFSQNYMKNKILNNDVKPPSISDEIFGTKDKGRDWVKVYAEKLVNNDGKQIIENLHNNGIINDGIYYMLTAWWDEFVGTNKETAIINITKVLNDSLDYVAANFNATIGSMRSTYNSALTALKVKDIPLNVYFDKVLIPKDLDSSYITDLMYQGSNISGFGLDSRDTNAYNKIISPLKNLPTTDVSDFDDDLKMTKYDYTNDNDVKVSLDTHYINAYISGNFATSQHIGTGDVIDVKATRMPLVGLADVNNLDSYPDVFLKVKGVVEESSIYSEIYFNKIDFFDYLKAYISNDWMSEIRDKKDANNMIGAKPKNNKKPINTRKVDPSEYPLGIKRELYYIQEIIDDINSDQPDAKYTLNNSVFSKTSIPYGFSHWTMNTKTGIGYTILDYIDMPIFNYSSDSYPLNYTNSLYIFSLISQNLMRSIQPIITTLNKFVAILLILTFVVALILINLVLWENKPTILLFKAMGYRKSEVDGYLLAGYIVADLVGLAVGIIISFFGIRYASTIAFSMLKVSLFFVWSWQFILTAALMAVIFIIMIFGSVTWYTRRQKPRDAFNTL